MEKKKVLLSVKDLHVKFRVRGRILTAIRGISLDFYENESVAIVGESGSGKSVFTKTFAGMLETNGFISEGSIIFNDDDISATKVAVGKFDKLLMRSIHKQLTAGSKLIPGAQVYKQIEKLKQEKKEREYLSADERQQLEDKIDELRFQSTELFNSRQTIDSRREKARYKEITSQLNAINEQIAQLEKQKKAAVTAHKKAARSDAAYNKHYAEQMSQLHRQYKALISEAPSTEAVERNGLLTREIYLSVGRYGLVKRLQTISALMKAIRKAMQVGADLDDEEVKNSVFDQVVFRVKFQEEKDSVLYGTCVVNLAKVRYSQDWTKIRGGKIATVFQDPMTSLNPIITIGKQITSVILKHQDCTEAEARGRALELMKKVGIPNAENRFDDYPFQYSGGMRQRIVIAIALSCQPKILICDEPTTALDVTIQAQILRLIKDLQKEFGYTIVFITHDLGVVANVADRVAVLYAGQVVELGTCEEVFYDPRHPYTWALLSSLPQLAQRNTTLYSITGTPPSLYNKIVGDAFAPRNPYCLKVDTLKEPPMFQVSETHFAKTWLLDPRAPKVEKPEAIQNIHEKLMDAFNI